MRVLKLSTCRSSRRIPPWGRRASTAPTSTAAVRRSSVISTRVRRRSSGGTDPPPLKWSALRYGFGAKEDHDAEEETQARGDRCEAAPGGRAGVTRAERCRRGTLDWGYRGHVLPLAPGVWRAQERSGQATEGSRD